MGYELVSILQQQNIRVETVDAGNLSELLVASWEALSNGVWPKGDGRSFPGGTNNLLTSSDLASASY